MKDKKIIVILGQTSTGKSDFAVEVAKHINGEIISADSRQVYKGMNLGTGKITTKEMQKIPHYLLDVSSPSKIFSVSDFQKLATRKIEEIFKKGKIPIICGGTGFYIDSLLNQTSFPIVKPDKRLRLILEKKTTEQLFEMLEKLDSVRAKNIDKKNRVRLIRAIEIAKSIGKIPQIEKNISAYNALKIGFHLDPETLKDKIKIRLISRLKKGMIKEVENLHKSGLSWKRMYALGLEYRNISLYLQGKLSKDEMINQLNTEIWHFAKRQKTWFKRDKNIIWVDPTSIVEKAKAHIIIKDFVK